MDCGKTSAKSLIYVIVRCGYRTISRHDKFFAISLERHFKALGLCLAVLAASK